MSAANVSRVRDGRYATKWPMYQASAGLMRLLLGRKRICGRRVCRHPHRFQAATDQVRLRDISKHESSGAISQAAKSAEFHAPLENPSFCLLEAAANIRRGGEAYGRASNIHSLQLNVDRNRRITAIELPSAA